MHHNISKSQDQEIRNAENKEHPRLQTHLEHLGVASRRHAAKIIESGVVKVNGIVVMQPGFRIENPYTDVVTVDGKTLPQQSQTSKTTTIMLNKPRGLICSADDSQGDTIYECLDGITERVVPVGRLDKDSEGLLLLSNDGELINQLTHPKYGHTKEYTVIVCGYFDEDTLDFLQSPIKIDGYRIKPVCVEYVKRLNDSSQAQRHKLRFTLTEGRNHQIRNMCEQAELRIQKLIRTAINNLRLPREMSPGEWRLLTPQDWDDLNQYSPHL